MRKRNPMWPGEAIERRFSMMESIVDELVALPEGNYGFSGKDEGAFHVHAAAAYASVDVLLTRNRAVDFTSSPDAEMYEILAPDQFFVDMARAHPQALGKVVRAQAVHYSGLERHSGDLLTGLRRAGCPGFAEIVESCLEDF